MCCMQAGSYTLKTMVFIRMFAEVSVFCVLVAAPVITMVNGQFPKLPGLIQSLLVVAAIVALLILPVYGFITYRVSVDVDGLRTIALFRQQFVQWDRITGLRLRTAFGWRRYVVIAQDDSVSFPIWLTNIDQLVEQIRTVLPQGGRMVAVAGAKVFAQDTIGTAFTIFKLIIGIGFIFIFWTFYIYLQSHRSKHADPSDALVILGGCSIFTALMLWRSYVIVMMPRMVSTDADGITYRTWFKHSMLPWSDVTGLAPPFFLLPEGIVVKSKKGQLLIGNELDAFDELQDELRERAPAAKS
jgi:hypothetical protein